MCFNLRIGDDADAGESMRRSLPVLFWIELVLSVLSAISLALSLVNPQWIETLFEVSPDAGDGSTEWGWTIGFLISTVLLIALTRREWQKARTT
jgi:hypothetical protein